MTYFHHIRIQDKSIVCIHCEERANILPCLVDDLVRVVKLFTEQHGRCEPKTDKP